MFSTPTESSTKACRRSSYADVIRRPTLRQSSQDDHSPTKSFERSIKWHWTSQGGAQLAQGRRFHSAVAMGHCVYVFGGERRDDAGIDKKKVLLNDLIMFDARESHSSRQRCVL